MSDRDRFFLALLPPLEFQDYANTVRQLFSDRYDSRKAFNSPPHITLQPSFDWPEDEVESLVTALTDCARNYRPAPVCLLGFGSFPPHVIFINVLRTTELLLLQANLQADCLDRLGVEAQIEREYMPHMTVAFRDLTEQNFQRAWPLFKQQALGVSNHGNGAYHFMADRLVLLKHDGQRWQVFREIAIGG